MGCDAIVGMRDEAAVISDKVRRRHPHQILIEI